MSSFYLALLIAFVFYVIIPGAGAVFVRAKWRRFRRALYHAASLPRASYGDIRAIREGDPAARERCFFGKLEALHGDNRIWLRDGSSSVEVDMADAQLVVLPPYQDPYRSLPPTNRVDFPNETPQMIPWRRVTSLTEGSDVFVAGQLTWQDGNAVYSRVHDSVPLVLLFDGPEEHVLERAVWTGRQRNEYWSLVTPVALLSGMFALSILSMQVMAVSYVDALLTLGLAGIPVLPLLPPAVPGYFLYRRLWRNGRSYRAARDGLRLSRVYLASTEHNEGIRRNQRRAVIYELAAVAVLSASVFVNYIVAVRVLAMLL